MSKPTKFNGMMHELCVQKGFCGTVIDGKPSHITDFIPRNGRVYAEDFAIWLLTAESIEPDYSIWKQEIIKIFVKHMGSAKVDATLLR